MKTADFFSGEAAQWESRYASDARFRRRYERITRLLERVLPKLTGEALDLGCGTGVFSRFLASQGWRVTGLDISGEMIAEARSQSDNIEYHVGTLEEFVSETNRFTAIIALSMLEYVDDDEVTIQRLADLLAPGGVLVVSVPNRSGLLRKIEGTIYGIRTATRGRLFADRGDYLAHQRRQYSPLELDIMMRRVGLKKKRAIFLNAGLTRPKWLLPFLERRFVAAMYCAAYRKR